MSVQCSVTEDSVPPRVEFVCVPLNMFPLATSAVLELPQGVMVSRYPLRLLRWVTGTVLSTGDGFGEFFGRGGWRAERREQRLRII